MCKVHKVVQDRRGVRVKAEMKDMEILEIK